jgi:hypothetical protein
MKIVKEIESLNTCMPTDTPFINLFLDTRLTKTGKRKCDAFLETNYTYVHCEFLVNGGDIDSFIKSWKMINDILDNVMPKGVEGLILIIRLDPDYDFIFMNQFPFPLENKIIVDGTAQICYVLELLNQENNHLK